ncbi:MAG: MMPL family transporter [Thermoplasmata archaeon]
MIFDKLGNFVVRRHVELIIAWLVILFYVFPTIFTVNDVVSYQETEFLDKDYESKQAGAIIKEQFPGETANSSMLIVIVNEDLTSAQNRDLVMALEAEIRNSAQLKYFDSTVSIYDVYRTALKSGVIPLAPNMTLLEEQTNLSLQLLFGIPQGYAMTFEGVNMTAFLMFSLPKGYAMSYEGAQLASTLLFGIPDGYVTSFKMVNQTALMVYGIPNYYFTVWYSTSGNDIIADAQTRSYISSFTAGMDPLNASLVWGYYDAFNQSWALLGMNPYYMSNPIPRLDESINQSVDFIATTLPPEYSIILTEVHDRLTKYTFTNPLDQSVINYDLVYAGMAGYLSDPSTAQMAVGLLNATHAAWMNSFMANSSWNVSQRIGIILPGVHQTFIANSGLTPGNEEYQLFTAVIGNLTLANYGDAYALSDLSFDIVFSNIAAYLTDPTFAPMAYGFLTATNEVWKQSFSLNPGWNASTRLSMVLPGIHSAFLASSGIPSTSKEYRMLSAVAGNLTLMSYQDPIEISGLTHDLIVSELGAYLSDPMSSQLALGIFQSTHNRWLNSVSGNPSMSSEERLEILLPAIHLDFLSIVESILPENQASLFESLTISGGNFGLSNYSDPATQHSFVINFIADEAGISNKTFLEEVYLLGSSPTEEEIDNLVGRVIAEGRIGSYPIELPADITRSFINDGRDTMLLIVTFKKDSGYRESNGEQPIVRNVDVIRDISGRYEVGGLRIYVTGEAPITSDLSKMADKDLALIEPVTIALVLILMGLFFRAVLGPIIPLGSIAMALGLSQAVIIFIGTFIANVHFTVLTLVVAVLFGVGTDYSIFILARYREELLKGAAYKDAMHTSIAWAGESIATSGATVIISFSVLSLSSFSMLQTMGMVLGIVILIALLVALTLVPSIALLLKGRLFWPITGERWQRYRENYAKRRKEKRGGYFRRAARFSTRHAILVFAVALLISVPTTYLYLTSKTSYDFIGGMAENESVQGLDVMSSSFGAGRISPTDIVIRFDAPVVLENGTFDTVLLDAIENVSARISTIDENVHQVVGPTRPNGDWVNYSNMSSLSEADRALLVMQMRSFIGKDNRTVRLQAIFVDEPYTSESLATVRSIRTFLSSYKSSDSNLASSEIYVGGASAGMVDIDGIMSVEFNQMEAGVIIGVFIVLLIVLGSVILPAFAILSIGLSISWTLAATLLVFGEVLMKPVLWLMPVVLFIILMGLGMDYNIFILTRIREEAQKRENHEKAIIEAVDRTGGIITACALIMAGAFGTLMLSGTTILQEFGFALSFAVLLDAMLVRTYITPAIMKILGPKWTWWAPGRLQRVRPEKMKTAKVKDDSELDD